MFVVLRGSVASTSMNVPSIFIPSTTTVVSVQTVPFDVGRHELEYVYDVSVEVSAYVPAIRRESGGAVESEQANARLRAVAATRSHAGR